MSHIPTALITGASRGIGAATAAMLFDAGWNVVINYNHSRAQAETLARVFNERDVPQRAIAVQADISDRASVARLFEETDAQFSTLDLLVNNAGIAQQKLFTDVTEEDWRALAGVHLDGTFYCSQEALRRMIPRHSGRIVNISSMWGQVGGSCEVPYSAMKAGVIGLTKALAQEVGPSNITVNCICPGVIETEMNAILDEETKRELADETPLCTLGTPEDVAAAVLFFASDGAKFVTGQILGVNGGLVV